MTSIAPAEPCLPSRPLAPDPFPDVNLVDRLLSEQQDLETPAATFSKHHDDGRFPDRQALYRHLIPLTRPGPGEQYAFQVELDKCTGCKACVTACHSLNGLDEGESWRDVGTLTGGDDDPAWQQTVTSACHHCSNPECLNGCPVGAYDKDDETGIVRHLDDQCIGCEYCIMKCPYDVPKYSKRRGIVRKCDMCHQRLAVGEAPACVQACPTSAIRIVNVDAGQSAVSFLTGAPDPSLTLPTTIFNGREVPATASPADRADLVPQPAHWPLVFMLTFTQLGIGLFTASILLPSTTLACVGITLFLGGLGLGVFHLGRPLGAWRFYLGLRTSWLSREFLVFGLVGPGLLVSGTLALLESPSLALASLTAALGLLGVYTSIMVYADTGRPGWALSQTGFRFGGTVLVAFLGGLACTGTLPPAWFAGTAAGKLGWEALGLLHAFARDWSPSRHSARLQLVVLKPILIARLACGLAAILSSFVLLPAALALFITGELLERLLFFRSVPPSKMPGPATVAPANAH